MKVYVVTCYEEEEIFGVFSTKEAAEKAKAAFVGIYDFPNIEEHVVDSKLATVSDGGSIGR